jgi:hypothetical protein
MFRRFMVFVVLFIVFLSNCGLWSIIQSNFANHESTSLYTDAEAQGFAQRLVNMGFGEQLHQRGILADAVLQQAGIDKQRLRFLGNDVGNCFDVAKYDLSLHYQLWIDNNACFGFGIWIVKSE